ncbi:MAG: VWA domain-containing protein [Treponemataceae bacterium]|nr:VWA domain-containing protein [Treponemataceae bacterium]
MATFEHPFALVLLLLPFALFALRTAGVFRRVSFPLTLSDWGGKTFAWNGAVRRFFLLVAGVLCGAGYALLVVALANPLVHRQEKVYTTKGTDILFVLDTSPSMAAQDIAGMTRLEAAKVALHTMVAANKGAAFGLVAMANEAAAVVPPTIDQTLFLRRLDALVPGGLGEGTAIGVGLSAAVYHLIASSAPKKCIVLITDGENNAGAVHPETAARLAARQGITIYTFGIGTRGSVPIAYVDPETGRVRSGYYASEFDHAPLEDIARIAGGQYFGVEHTAALAERLAAISQLESVAQSFYVRSVDEPFGQQFLCAGVVALVAAWVLKRLFLGEIL